MKIKKKTYRRIILSSFLISTMCSSAIFANIVYINNNVIEPVIRDVNYIQESEEEIFEDWDYPLTKEDLDVFARLIDAETGLESVTCQRLVIDTILNRVESNNFPNSIREIMYQDGQFASISSGSINNYNARESVKNLIIEEMNEKTNSDVIFFNSGSYSKYGKPLVHIGRLYFSGDERIDA